MTFHLERAGTASQVGEPTDTDEAVRVEWIPLIDVPDMIREGGIGDGLSAVGLLAHLAGI